MQQQPKQQRKIKLELPTDPTGTYANTVMISHSPQEFVLDFIQILPGDPRARVSNRIIMTPVHAKMFMKAMQNNIERYEGRFSDIPTPEGPGQVAEQLFRNIFTRIDEARDGDSVGDTVVDDVADGAISATFTGDGVSGDVAASDDISDTNAGTHPNDDASPSDDETGDE